jgi:membrane-bound lytic murein transglycosylase
MQYTVNIEEKTVTWAEELPNGHKTAIRKIFEPQGYTFIEGYGHERVASKGLYEQLKKANMHSYTSTTKQKYEDHIAAMEISMRKEQVERAKMKQQQTDRLKKLFDVF